MAPELSALFMIPTNILRRRRDGAESPARKRAKTAGGEVDEDDEAIEHGRRQERSMSERFLDASQRKDNTFDDDMIEPIMQDEPVGFDDMGMPETSSVRGASMMRSPSAPVPSERLMSEARSIRAPSLAPSVMMSPDDCPIGFFDTRIRSDGTTGESQSQAQVAASQYLVEDEASQADARERGFSQNTVKAVGFLRNEFSTEDGRMDEDKTISFEEKATKVCGNLP